jgi:hypothetical protein
MSKRVLERVTCTLPADLVKAADAIAQREGRSRSWVVAEALRRYLAADVPASPPPGRVREQARHPYGDEFEDARRQRRDGDLALTPEQRVRAAEELAQMAADLHPRPRYHGVLAFDTWEDFATWKKRDSRG